MRPLIAAVVLAGWLVPLSLPVLCRGAVLLAEPGCEQPMAAAPGAAVVASPSHQLPCANPALCGVPPIAAPAGLGTTLAATPLERFAFLPVSQLQPGDSRAPIPPPPQA